MDVQEVKEKINDLKSDLLTLIDNRFESILNNFHTDTSNGLDGRLSGTTIFRRRVGAISTTTLNSNSTPDIGDELLSRPKSDLQEKEFVRRDSLLTELFQSPHIRTIYHIFVAILIILIISSMMHDLMDTGTLNLKFEIIRWCFGKLPIVITIWLVMFLSCVVILYPVFQHWAYLSGPVGWLDYCYLGAYVAYILAMVVMPIKCIFAYDLPLASTFIVASEQVRLIMKAHAFVRENACRALVYKAEKAKGTKRSDDNQDHNGNKNDKDNNESPCPDFGKFLYFLFAPTLVYRNNYPRTAQVDWSYVATNFAQVFACLFYLYYVFSHFCIPVFQNFNRDHISIRTFILTLFSSVLPGSLCLFLGFFAILHSWLNAFAEMLRFGDRLFYKDWWNATNLAVYYRTWNVVVHDWLYTYVYRDTWLLTGRKGRSIAILAVFFISALVHEYIVAMAFRFFYPVLFIEFFCISVWIMFMTNSKQQSRGWNVFIWFSLFIGTGLMMCLYSMEWYARINCPRAYDNFLYYFTPHSWICKATSADILHGKSLIELK